MQRSCLCLDSETQPVTNENITESMLMMYKGNRPAYSKRQSYIVAVEK
jgi:hypothetical protein